MVKRVLAALLLAVLVAAGGSAQVRGTGRLSGVVADTASGKTIEGATITISYPDGKSSPISAQTDKKGRWAVLGLVSGALDVDVTAPGYIPFKTRLSFSEQSRVPPVTVKLVAEAKVEERTIPAPEVPAVPPEAVEAVRAGEAFMKEEKYKEAIAEFEKALPQIPDDTTELQTVRRQVQQVLAQAYYKSGELKKAIELLEKVTAVTSDPFASANAAPMTGVQLLLVNLYLEDAQLDKGKALLEKLPESAVSDPVVYINMGIVVMNQKKAAEAVPYFSKAIVMKPEAAEAYYYRALAYLHQKKNKEAKADLEKVVALALADSAEARDAKQLLAGLNK